MIYLIIIFGMYLTVAGAIASAFFRTNMRIELAPMEGITSYIYRQTLNKYYGGVDTYFTPFISTHKDKELNFKEKNEIRPENNVGMTLVPQVLTANADEFLYTSGKIATFGYDHVNINFGCPSGTVTTKGKGSGALQDLENLDRVLEQIFSRTELKVSIKTRLGFTNESEWENILKIYEKYPLEELIVHARVREDFYNGTARIEALKFCSTDFDVIRGSNEITGRTECGSCKYSYNGDVYSFDDYVKVSERFSNLDAVMIGRGIIARPWLAAEIKKKTGGSDFIQSEGVNTSDGLETFKAFNLELVDRYDEIMPGEKNTLFKVKELWTYMIHPFDDDKKLIKAVRKCSSIRDYRLIINSLR